jgi:hypothetical protein
MTATDTANKPFDKVRYGLITVTIWANSTEKGTFYSFTLERRYKDKEGNWQSTQKFDEDDALLLAKAIDEAHSIMAKARQKKD